MVNRIMHAIRHNLVAWLALFVALGGTGLAASHYVINSTKQINPKVLRKLKGNSGRTGPAGPAGAQGAAGQNGEAGPAGQARAYAVVEPGSSSILAAGSRGVLSATVVEASFTCVILEPAINLQTAVVLVAARSAGADFNVTALPRGCEVGAAKGVRVETYNPNGTPRDDVPFSILVP